MYCSQKYSKSVMYKKDLKKLSHRRPKFAVTNQSVEVSAKWRVIQKGLVQIFCLPEITVDLTIVQLSVSAFCGEDITVKTLLEVDFG